MGQVDLSGYKKIYLQTAKEYIDKMFVSLDKLGNDILDKEALNSLHISSHSLRSQSQVMGFENIVNISANIEKISSDILNKIRKIDSEFLSILDKSVKELNSEFSLIEKTQ